jgi:hypothetical protein
MELPIDTSGLTFLCALSPRPVVDDETAQPEVDGQGRPLYAVSLVVLGEQGAQVLSVQCAGEPDPAVRQGAFVRVLGLVASSWWVDDMAGATFTAASVEALPGPGAEPGAGR